MIVHYPESTHCQYGIGDLNFQCISCSIMGSALPVFKFTDDDFSVLFAWLGLCWFLWRCIWWLSFHQHSCCFVIRGWAIVLFGSLLLQLCSLDSSFCTSSRVQQLCRKRKFHCSDKFSERFVNIPICCICSPQALSLILTSEQDIPNPSWWQHPSIFWPKTNSKSTSPMGKIRRCSLVKRIAPGVELHQVLDWEPPIVFR